MPIIFKRSLVQRATPHNSATGNCLSISLVMGLLTFSLQTPLKAAFFLAAWLTTLASTREEAKPTDTGMPGPCRAMSRRRCPQSSRVSGSKPYKLTKHSSME